MSFLTLVVLRSEDIVFVLLQEPQALPASRLS